MRTDLRLALRMLFRKPRFMLIAVLTLALGIGATSAVFSLIEGVLLTPPPYRQSEKLVLVHSLGSDGQPSRQGWAALQWMDWQRQAKSLEGIAAYQWTFNFLIGNDGSESMQGMVVTREYFDITGLQPILGRSFVAAEAGRRTPPVVLIGYDLWRRKFNGDPHIIGKTIRISRFDTPPTVIGVMPPGVRFLPSPGAAQEPNYNVNGLVQFWIPVTTDPARVKDMQWDVVARLRDGATPARAESELRILASRQAQTERSFEGFTPKIELLSNELNAAGGRILIPLMGAAALVLLIACGNAAALLLVRGLQRQQEYAVRSALGVRRIALFRQIATESLLLSFSGGVIAAGVTIGVVRLFKMLGRHAIPRLDAVTIGWPVLLFGLSAAVLSAMLAGLYPALRASRLDCSEALKSAGPKSSASRGERRLLAGVTIAQTALTLALLVGAGLLIRTMINLSRVQAGYDARHILSMTVTTLQDDWIAFHRRALDRVKAVPGVEDAAFAWGVPLTGNNWPVPTEIEGQPVPTKASDRTTLLNAMRRIAALDSILLVHAEDPSRLLVPKGTSAMDFNRSRPPAAERAAIETAIELAVTTGCRLHVVHVSTARGLNLIREAQRKGHDVSGETCPHYLLYVEEDLERLGGRAKCAPPFRIARDQEALWAADMIVSDHSPSTAELKAGDDFTKIWGGISGCQSTRQLLLAQGRLDLPSVAAVTSTNVARRFRMPGKGNVAPGYDADLWLVDLAEEGALRREDLLYRNAFSAHEGQRIRGRTIKTLVGGREPGSGSFIRPAAR